MISIFDRKFNFWAKVQFLIKMSICEQYFNFWSILEFLSEILILDQNLIFYEIFPFFRFLTKFRHFEIILDQLYIYLI